MASPVPELGVTAQPPEDRTRDSLATSLGKSYGTVKDATQTMSSTYRTVIDHDVVKEDTLQGLALKYDVTVSRVFHFSDHSIVKLMAMFVISPDILEDTVKVVMSVL